MEESRPKEKFKDDLDKARNQSVNEPIDEGVRMHRMTKEEVDAINKKIKSDEISDNIYSGFLLILFGAGIYGCIYLGRKNKGIVSGVAYTAATILSFYLIIIAFFIFVVGRRGI